MLPPPLPAQRLAAYAGARLVLGEATGLDLEVREVGCGGEGWVLGGGGGGGGGGGERCTCSGLRGRRCVRRAAGKEGWGM